MRIALAQINPTLGDFNFNRKKILSYVDRAQDKHCDLVVFPESSLFGYHPMDLLERSNVVTDQLAQLAKIEKELPSGIAIMVGAVTKNKQSRGRPWRNSAVLLQAKKVPKIFSKTLLPNYDVFDETRYMEPGDLTKNIFKLSGQKILVTICEDIWAWPSANATHQNTRYPQNPLKEISPADVDLVINLSASPYTKTKYDQRLVVAKKVNGYFKSSLIYVNMVGAQDELIFDGNSFATDPTGKIICKSMAFEEDLNIVDIPAGKKQSHKVKKTYRGGHRPVIATQIESVRQALVLGLRDFAQKTKLDSFHLGLSGGLDSAVVACLAVDALGPFRVTCLGLPSPFNAPESLKLAKQLTANLHANWMSIPISATYKKIIESLEKPLEITEFSLVNENVQARLRGLLLMAFSNKHSSLLLNTSNKSELAVGYSTLYGDLCGGICPIGDLLKTEVYQLAAHYNQQTELIPNHIITRPPSAELRPNQTDQESLPAYEKLDPIIKKLVEDFKPARTKLEKEILKKILNSEFKRWQAPPILKVSARAFGRGRRCPIAHRALY